MRFSIINNIITKVLTMKRTANYDGCVIDVEHISGQDWFVSDAPMDGTPITGALIQGNYEPIIQNVFWSETPVCMLGPRNGSFDSGWATDGSECDYNLPSFGTGTSEDLTHWRPIDAPNILEGDVT